MPRRRNVRRQPDPLADMTVRSQKFRAAIGGYLHKVAIDDDTVLALDRGGHGPTVYVVSERIVRRFRVLLARHGWEDATVTKEREP
jgi:hypothetical protein